MRCFSHVTVYGRGQAYAMCWWKPQEKEPLERQKMRWKNKVKVGLQEEKCGVWTGSD
jgi:hypothetical protein